MHEVTATVGRARVSLTLLGKRIRYARRLKRLSQTELAELVGATQTAVTRWEIARRLPTIRNLGELADALDTTIPYLLGCEGYDEPFRVFTGEIPLRKVSEAERERAAGHERIEKGAGGRLTKRKARKRVQVRRKRVKSV